MTLTIVYEAERASRERRRNAASPSASAPKSSAFAGERFPPAVLTLQPLEELTSESLLPLAALLEPALLELPALLEVAPPALGEPPVLG